MSSCLDSRGDIETAKFYIVTRVILSVLLLLLIGYNSLYSQCEGIEFECPNFDLIVDLAVDTAGNLNLCEGEPITFLNQTSDNLAAIDSFVWIWNYLADPTAPQECIIAHSTETVSHVYHFEDSVICMRPNQDYIILSVGLAAIDTNGCFSLVQSNEILVNILPRALFVVTQHVCQGDPVQFINQSCPVTDDISFYWESQPDGQTSTEFTPGFIYPDTGTYTVTLTATNATCDDVDTYTQEVVIRPYPEPAYAILNPASGDSLCAGLDTLILANLSTYSDSVRWDIFPSQDIDFLNNSQGSDTAYVIISAAGDYTIALHVLNRQCESDTSFQFTVLETPFLDLDDLPDCWDQPIIDLNDFVNINNGLPPDFTITVTYVADGTTQVFIDMVPSAVNLSEIGTYEVHISSVSSCGEIIRQESIGYFPAIQFIEPDVLCGEQDTVVNLNDYLDNRPDMCLKWEGPGVYSDSLFNPLTVGDGLYDLVLTDCDTVCINTHLELTVIGPTIPVEDFSICLIDEPISLDDLLEGQWSGLPVAGDSLVPMLTGTGSYEIYFATDNSAPCVVADTVVVTVRDTVHADFTVNEPNCADSLFSFVNLSSAPVIRWYFGDGSTSIEETPSHQFASPGTYQVSLVAGETNGGCRDSVVLDVLVQELPTADIGVIVDSVGCDSIHIALFALPLGASFDYQWDINGDQILFGDSVIATVAALDTTQEITVQLQAGNTCGTVFVSQPITVPPGFLADLVYDSEEIKCPGELVDFINVSNNVDSFIIDYGNGLVTVNEVLDTSFSNTTDSTLYYEVVIYGFNPNCGWDTGKVVVPVRPAHVIASALYSDNAICADDAIYFINNSALQDQTILFFGDGGSALMADNDTIVYAYPEPGIFTPVVIALGCGTDTNYLDPIEVFANPDFEIEVTPGEPCIGEAVLLVNSGNTLSPTWTLGNDTLAQFTDTLYFYPAAPGIYEVVLHAVAEGDNFCGSTDTISFMVGMGSSLTAEVDPVYGCAPLEVQVQLNSGSVTDQYHTDFGNQQIGTSSSVSTIYSQEGSYNIEMTVVNEDGCTDDTVISVHVLEEYSVEALGDTIILIGEPVELDFQVNHSFETFSWTANNMLLGTNTERPLEDHPLVNTLYTIEVDGVGANCQDTDDLFVKILCDEIFLPDAFSPNGDGVNDTYGIYKVFDNYFENTRTSCIELIDWEVYDRWGELLFRTTSFDDSWDGSFRREALNIGMYLLVVRYRSNRNEEQIVRKEIHLLK